MALALLVAFEANVISLSWIVKLVVLIVVVVPETKRLPFTLSSEPFTVKSPVIVESPLTVRSLLNVVFSDTVKLSCNVVDPVTSKLLLVWPILTVEPCWLLIVKLLSG